MRKTSSWNLRALRHSVFFVSTFTSKVVLPIKYSIIWSRKVQFIYQYFKKGNVWRHDYPNLDHFSCLKRKWFLYFESQNNFWITKSSSTKNFTFPCFLCSQYSRNTFSIRHYVDSFLCTWVISCVFKFVSLPDAFNASNAIYVRVYALTYACLETALK